MFDKKPKTSPAKSETRKMFRSSMYPKRFEVSSPLICPPARYGTVNLPISPVILGDAVELAKAISSNAITFRNLATPAARIFIATPETI